MWGILHEVILVDEGEVRKINVTILKDTQLYRKLNLTIGDTFIVEPVKKNKKKHRGRLVQIHSFVDDFRGKLRVRVKFIDNGRLGFVELDDLNTVKQG
ncbi:hypothetical protein ABG775_21730 [Peribacillus simplex]|uniref:hypothetical protein n=1 Tax=Peribacillus simplex TaxID=1478 RepID=UPI00339480C0